MTKPLQVFIEIVHMGKESAFDSAAFILSGSAIAVYGLFAQTFRESSRLHVLTPTNKLEKYVPHWYQRLILVVLGSFVVLRESLTLLRR